MVSCEKEKPVEYDYTGYLGTWYPLDPTESRYIVIPNIDPVEVQLHNSVSYIQDYTASCDKGVINYYYIKDIYELTWVIKLEGDYLRVTGNEHYFIDDTYYPYNRLFYKQ